MSRKGPKYSEEPYRSQRRRAVFRRQLDALEAALSGAQAALAAAGCPASSIVTKNSPPSAASDDEDSVSSSEEQPRQRKRSTTTRKPFTALTKEEILQGAIDAIVACEQLIARLEVQQRQRKHAQRASAPAPTHAQPATPPGSASASTNSELFSLPAHRSVFLYGDVERLTLSADWRVLDLSDSFLHLRLPHKAGVDTALSRINRLTRAMPLLTTLCPSHPDTLAAFQYFLDAAPKDMYQPACVQLLCVPNTHTNLGQVKPVAVAAPCSHGPHTRLRSARAESSLSTGPLSDLRIHQMLIWHSASNTAEGAPAINVAFFSTLSPVQCDNPTLLAALRSESWAMSDFLWMQQGSNTMIFSRPNCPPISCLVSAPVAAAAPASATLHQHQSGSVLVPVLAPASGPTPVANHSKDGPLIAPQSPGSSTSGESADDSAEMDSLSPNFDHPNSTVSQLAASFTSEYGLPPTAACVSNAAAMPATVCVAVTRTESLDCVFAEPTSRLMPAAVHATAHCNEAFPSGVFDTMYEHPELSCWPEQTAFAPLLPSTLARSFGTKQAVTNGFSPTISPVSFLSIHL